MVFIIGEIGTNHLGDLNIAKKIIQCAVNTGFDAVKFQKKNVEKIYTQEFLNSPLDSPWGTTQREMRLHREFSDKQFESIDKFCKKLKIPWFVSCWDTESQLSMRKFNLKYNKVASAMIIHEKLLKIIAEEQKYTFISTGMSTLKEIKNAVEIFKKFNCPHELLHANSSYPMKTEEANLKLIPFLKKKFKCNVGYSGHETFASLISVTAVLQGASTVERHITIDRTAYGHDQAASLEEPGLRRMIRDVKLIDEILGDGEKRVWESEHDAMEKLRQIFI